MQDYTKGLTAPTLSPLALNAVVATYFPVMLDTTFWSHPFRIVEGRTVTALVFAGTIWALMLLVISTLALRRMPVLVAPLVGLLFTDLKALSTVLRADKEPPGSVRPLAPTGETLAMST